MTAEVAYAILLLVFVAGFVVGDLHRRREERGRERERANRVHGIYAGIREW